MIAVDELELEGRAWLEALHQPAFERTEDRKTRRVRLLDCGHRIDRGEPYRYTVWKLRGTAGVEQLLVCDVCRRSDSRY